MVQDFFHQQYDCESWIRVWKKFDDRIPKNICSLCEVPPIHSIFWQFVVHSSNFSRSVKTKIHPPDLRFKWDSKIQSLNQNSWCNWSVQGWISEHTLQRKRWQSHGKNETSKDCQTKTGWWNFKHFYLSPPKLGKMNPFWQAYVANGLVQPPPTKSEVVYG